MAERRMFAKTIIDSDAFLEMPLSTQALYFHLSMRADDDGFINNPKKIQRVIGASDDDLRILLAKRFLISFESGVVVIKHWKIHNYIQKDRYKTTVYQEELSHLEIKKNGAYTADVSTLDTGCIHNGYSLETQDSIGKVSIGEYREGEDSIGNTPPLSPSGENEKKPPFDLESHLIPYSWSAEMKDTVRNWFAYKQERREGYKERGATSLLSQVDKYIVEFGEGKVINAINNAMANNYQGMGLDRISTNGSGRKQTKNTSETKEEYLNRMAKEWGYTPEGENDFTGNTEIIDAD